ncbi:MAG TPA: sialidase family protein [Candidatus Hydrogenedentes bacterium]|nr:sialidase family protein [Candidatus Hydrogenedentota bacterium]
MIYRRVSMVVVTAFAAAFAALAQQPIDAQHSIVAIEKDRFHGWPANNGAWQWGDEFLVGFTQGDLSPQDGHNIDGIEQSKFARSLDGGVTWQVFDPENFLDGPDIKWLPKGKTKLETPMDFTNPGFAMRVFASGYHGNDDPEGGYYYSYDRGATWKGPHFLGAIHKHEALKGKMLTPRTDYIVTGPKSCFVFISTRQDTMGRIACIQTTDGGLTFDFVSWVTPDTTEYRAIMPQTVRLSNGDYVMAFRKIFADQTELESTVDAYVSKDQCKTWSFLSTVKEIKSNSNPPALVELDDGRLCCIYGDRDARIVAGKYSSDRGATWGPEFTIRDGYLAKDDWADMGYPRLLKRGDGKLAALYYWATDENPQHFIACSIWDPGASASPQQQDLFFQGMNGVPVYRIPALAVTPRGAVLAVCDARADTGQDLPNDIDIVMRRSTDNGATWSEPKVIADFGKQGCGDAALLVDRSNGRVWCFFVYAPDGVGVSTSKPGVTGDTLQLYLMHSDDDGLTWSKPRNITAEVKDPAWEAVWSSPGTGYQDAEGRLYFPHSRKSGDTLYSHLIYSDDHGETWRAGGTAAENTDEWMLVQRADGSLLGNFRSNAGLNRRATATSSDRGATWRDFQHVSDLVEPVCQASLIWYDNNARQYLLFANPADTERRRLTIRASRDEGKTWPIAKVLHDGPAAYSSMAVLADGQIGILYERGDDTPYRKVTFAKFPLDWLLR